MSNDDQAFKLARDYLSLDRTLIGAGASEGYPGIAHDLETMRSALLKLHESRAMNAWAHSVVSDALKALTWRTD